MVILKHKGFRLNLVHGSVDIVVVNGFLLFSLLFF